MQKERKHDIVENLQQYQLNTFVQCCRSAFRYLCAILHTIEKVVSRQKEEDIQARTSYPITILEACLSRIQ